MMHGGGPGAVYERMDQLGLTQGRIAYEMQIDPSIISLWCKGKRPVAYARAVKLAEVLQLSLEELASLDPVMSVTTSPDPPGVPQPEPKPPPPTLEEWIASLPPEVGEPEPDLRPPMDPYPLWWCTKSHGTGRYRLHHHGPKPPYGPVGPLP